MSIPQVLPEFAPGTVVELSDITELAAFETCVAYNIDPDMVPSAREAWEARPHVRDLIRPPKFNGTIASIALEVMADPYERLLDAKERGWRTPASKGRNERRIEQLRWLYYGR
jgi:hypothetical protein